MKKVSFHKLFIMVRQGTFLIGLVLLLLCSCAHEEKQVGIIYFNDAHEISPVNDEYGERGGVARLKAVIDQAKEDYPGTISIFGGDLAGGTLFGSFYHGHPMVEAFNLIPIDYANFGQHDFDFGAENTRKLIDESEFQWLTSNLKTSNGKSFSGLPSHILTERNGIKIGLIGVTDAMNTTSPDSTVIQADLLESAHKEAEKLSDLQADFIIAITQTGFETNKQILESIPEIDAVFTEETSENISDVKYVENRPIIATCGNIGSAAHLILKKNGEKKSMLLNIYPIDSTVAENPELKIIQNKYQQKLDSSLNVVISKTLNKLDAGISTDFSCRWKESNLGDLITDAYRDHFKTDVAVINGGGIRANIGEGDITERDLRAVLPFGNKIVKVELTGKELKNLLEQGVSQVEKRSGRFLQISGAAYWYDSSQKPGNRIRIMDVAGGDVETDKIYSLALPEFILKGGDGFDISVIQTDTSEAMIDIDIVREYISSINTLYSIHEGRIWVIEEGMSIQF